MCPERRKGGRRSTDKHAAKTHVTLTNEQSPGVIEHDERGDARWVWATQQERRDSVERTFNELKALDNEALALLEQSDPSPTKPPGGGYNPYDVTAPPAKKPALKKRR